MNEAVTRVPALPPDLARLRQWLWTWQAQSTADNLLMHAFYERTSALMTGRKRL